MMTSNSAELVTTVTFVRRTTDVDAFPSPRVQLAAVLMMGHHAVFIFSVVCVRVCVCVCVCACFPRTSSINVDHQRPISRSITAR